MDKIDCKLIQILGDNARTPLKVLAEKVFLSPSAVSARLERLEREKIITGYHASVDSLKLGYPITAFINLAVEPIQKPEFYDYIKPIPNVLECNCITGNYSMLIKVIFQSTQQLDQFIGELQKFGHTQTQIVFATPIAHREVQLGDLE